MLQLFADTLVGIANWSSVEFTVAVICASLPTLRPLVRKLSPTSWKITSIRRSRGTTGNSGKRLNPRMNDLHGEEFQRLPDGGTETYAMHHVGSDKQPESHHSGAQDGILVTNTFGTNEYR